MIFHEKKQKNWKKRFNPKFCAKWKFIPDPQNGWSQHQRSLEIPNPCLGSTCAFAPKKTNQQQPKKKSTADMAHFQ